VASNSLMLFSLSSVLSGQSVVGSRPPGPVVPPPSEATVAAVRVPTIQSLTVAGFGFRSFSLSTVSPCVFVLVTSPKRVRARSSVGRKGLTPTGATSRRTTLKNLFDNRNSPPKKDFSRFSLQEAALA
jgi:hypothetical protein